MKIPVIKKLAEQYTIAELEKAEAAYYEESQPEMEIPGDDAGEQLTHVIASLEILREVNSTGCEFNAALRNYTQRVRNSIS